MTTNSPNPVDGDVQALIKFCNTVIADIKCDAVAHTDEVVMNTLLVFETALATLTAVPCAFLYGASFERGVVEGEIEDSPGTDMPVFTTPPAQLLRPVELPEPYDDGHGNLWLPQDAVISAVKNAGGEVKND